MYFLTFHCKPNPNNKDAEDAIGAYVNCYIEANSLSHAEELARMEIKEMDWNILTMDDAYDVDEESISDDGREYYEQALVDKKVYVFHTYTDEED